MTPPSSPRTSADTIQPSVKVLFMSGYTKGTLDAQGVLEPDVSLIEKPFTETTLLAKLHEALSAQ